MKTLVSLASLASLALALPAQATDRLADLERRCAEQERQIELLELENSRLRALQKPAELKTAPAPIPSTAPSPAETVTRRAPEQASSDPQPKAQHPSHF